MKRVLLLFVAGFICAGLLFGQSQQPGPHNASKFRGKKISTDAASDGFHHVYRTIGDSFALEAQTGGGGVDSSLYVDSIMVEGNTETGITVTMNTIDTTMDFVVSVSGGSSAEIINNSVTMQDDMATFTEAQLETQLSDVSALFTNNVTGDVAVSGATSTIGTATIDSLMLNQVEVGEWMLDSLSLAFSGDVAMTEAGVFTVVDDSHNHIISNIDAFSSADLAGKLLDEVGTGVALFETAIVRTDGTNALTANWPAGNFDITGLDLIQFDSASATTGNKLNFLDSVGLGTNDLVDRVNESPTVNKGSQIVIEADYAFQNVDSINHVLLLRNIDTSLSTFVGLGFSTTDSTTTVLGAWIAGQKTARSLNDWVTMDLLFATGVTGAEPQERMRILGNGRVGIGTNAPNAPFDMTGDTPGSVGGFPSGALHITSPSASVNSNAVITGHNSFGGNKQLWYLGSGSSSNDNIAFINRQSASLSLNTDNIERLKITNSGIFNFNNNDLIAIDSIGAVNYTDNSVADDDINFGTAATQVSIIDIPSVNWSIFHSNGSGVIVELAIGATGLVLKSNGTAAAPTWQTDLSGGSPSLVDIFAVHSRAEFDTTTAFANDSLIIKANGIDDTHLDFGTGAGQINIIDIPSPTTWSTVYWNATVPVALALGASGDVLTSGGTAAAPTWETPSGGGSIWDTASNSDTLYYISDATPADTLFRLRADANWTYLSAFDRSNGFNFTDDNLVDFGRLRADTIQSRGSAGLNILSSFTTKIYEPSGTLRWTFEDNRMTGEANSAIILDSLVGVADTVLVEDILKIKDFALYTGGNLFAQYDSTDIPTNGQQLTWATGDILNWQDAGAGGSSLWDSSTVKVDTILYRLMAPAQGGVNDTILQVYIDTSTGTTYIERDGANALVMKPDSILASGGIGIGTALPTGSEKMVITGGGNITSRIHQTGSNEARLFIDVDGAGTGDAWVAFSVTTNDFSVGMDNSDGDAFVISNGTLPGTNNAVRITAGTQVIQFNGAYTFPTSDGAANQILKTDGAGALTFQADVGAAPTLAETFAFMDRSYFDTTTALATDSLFIVDASLTVKGVASFATADFAVASGAVTIKAAGVDLTTQVTGTLPVGNGGTGAITLTDGGILLGSGSGGITALGVATNGQIPIGDGTTDPQLATITGGTGLTVVNAAASITIDHDAHTGNVTGATVLTIAVNVIDSTNITDGALAVDDVNWETEYMDLSIVHGYSPADSTHLTLPVFEGFIPILFVDSTNEASAKDTVYVSGTVPYGFTVDSLIFGYKVTGTSVLIDSLVLRGPNKTTFTNNADSTYFSSGTNRTSATFVRLAIDLTNFTARAGDRFALQFSNDLVADNGTVKVYYIQLAGKR